MRIGQINNAAVTTLANRVTTPHLPVTLEEAAALFKLSAEAIQESAERGELPGRRFGKDWRFSKLAVLTWLGRGQRGTRKGH
jgi:excisionase family DNA binding protein